MAGKESPIVFIGTAMILGSVSANNLAIEL
jgi:hypothetical protein